MTLRIVGSYDYQVDDRKRIPLPPKHRDAFEAGAYLGKSNRPSIVLYTPEALDKTAEIIEAIPAETREGEDARRDFFGSIWPTSKDAQGRVTLNEGLMAYAGITRDVRVIGVGDKFEIWDRETHIAYEAEIHESRLRALARRDPTQQQEG